MTIVCVDTQVLFWAIEGRGTNDQHLLKEARDFVNWIIEIASHIIIPSIVVGELLVPIEDTHIVKTLNRIKKDWIVVDYDVRAAMKFAQMRRNHAFEKRRLELRQLELATRRELVADAMIIATAIVNDADIIYTYDEPMCKLADGWIDAKDFTQENFPRSLF